MERNHFDLCNFERGHLGNIHMVLYKIWLRRRCGLKKKFTDGRQRPITIANLEPSAQVS